MNSRILFLIGIAILGIYMVPLAIAKYAGSHTWEFNDTAGAMSVNCVRCHGYISTELQGTGGLRAHENAAGNGSYTQDWLNLSIDNTTSFGVCHLCHINQLSSSPTHTRTTMRVCTDLDCHGSNATTNNTAYEEGEMGPKLGGADNDDPTNVHMRIFNQVSGVDSGILNETGSDYKRGFYLCIGCHTEVSFEIVREGSESFNHTSFTSAKKRYL